MKRQMFVLVGVLALLLAGGSAYAQSVRVSANVPFDFIVNGKTMPAGLYTINTVDASDTSALLIRSAQPKDNMIVLSQSVESLKAAKNTKLVFHQYGTRYFLSEIWVDGEQSGRQLQKASRENEMALDFPLQKVELLASLR